MGLSPGDRVDRYEVIELLGAGGMGEVYRAYDPRLARSVALKILRTPGSLDADGATRLLREARAAGALSHANVLAIYDVGEVHEPESLRGMPYIAMELVAGRSLRTYIGDESVPLTKRVGWLRDAASALGAAHRAGIVHRDVKPENVMIRRADGAVKVLDFGIAHRRATLDLGARELHSVTTNPLIASTEVGRIIGTPYFMAPEQLRGESLDGRADQFAWGVMAYMLVTGEGPWHASDALALVSQILSDVPTPPRDRVTDLPAALSEVIMRALAKVREARFESMDELVLALDAQPLVGGAVAPPLAPAVAPALAPRPVTTVVASAVTGSPQLNARLVRRWTALGFVLLALIGSAAAWRARPWVRGTAADTSLASARPQCTSSHDCAEAHRGAGWRCRTDGQCIELASPDCKVYADDLAMSADDTVWIGGMFPLTTRPLLAPEMRVAELARQDFATVLGPSAARAGQLHARPIGLVVCDEGVDAMRAARHLAEDVEAPGVLGFFDTASALRTIPTMFLPHHVLSFVTLSQAPSLTQIPQPPGEPRLVWRATLNRADYAAPTAHLITDVLEPAARRGAGTIDARPFKVATLLAKPGNSDIIDALFEILRFNGKSALDNGMNFRQFTFDPNAGATGDELARSLVDFAPNVIVYGGGVFAQVLEPLEAKWKGGPRPYYVTGQGMSDFIRFAGKDPSRRHRGFSVTALSTLPTNARLVLRYNMAFPQERPMTRSESAQPSYDAFYVFAYATYALGDQPVTGTTLAAAMTRLLPPGKRIDVGPADILDGFNVLRFGGPSDHIDLNGALGALDFDAATGEAPVDYAITCASVDDHGAASATIDSGLVYDARAQKLVGTLRCP